MNISGLEINQYFLKAVRLGQQGKNFVPKKVVFEPLAAGTIVDGLIANVGLFEAALTKLLKNFKPTGSSWVVSLPEKAAFSTRVKFPNLSKENLKEAVELNASNYLPGKKEEIFWGAQTLENTQDNSKEVLISSISKSHLMTYLNVFSHLKMNPIAIEPKSFSIARVFGKTEMLIILDVRKAPASNNGQVTVVILSQGAPHLAREFEIANFHDSGPLIKDIRLLLNYYLTEQRGNNLPFKTAIFDGGANNFPEIVEAIKNSYGFEVKDSSELFPFFKDKPELTLSLLGVGLRAAVGEKEGGLSLLPVGTSEAMEEKNTLNYLHGLTNIFFIFMILVLILFLGAWGFYRYLGIQADRQVAVLGKISTSNDPKKLEIQEMLKKINPKIEIEGKLEDQFVYWSPALKMIFDALPEGVTLSAVNLSKVEQPMVLTGMATSSETLSRLRENLSNLSITGTLQIPTSNSREDNSVNFTLNLTVKKEALKKNE